MTNQPVDGVCAVVQDGLAVTVGKGVATEAGLAKVVATRTSKQQSTPQSSSHLCEQSSELPASATATSSKSTAPTTSTKLFEIPAASENQPISTKLHNDTRNAHFGMNTTVITGNFKRGGDSIIDGKLFRAPPGTMCWFRGRVLEHGIEEWGREDGSACFRVCHSMFTRHDQFSRFNIDPYFEFVARPEAEIHGRMLNPDGSGKDELQEKTNDANKAAGRQQRNRKNKELRKAQKKENRKLKKGKLAEEEVLMVSGQENSDLEDGEIRETQ
ncbi:hypothetical protein HDU76_002237 [Blyttiomyces sp. JEL0837]|nr:hypothetical protein HDU76_002237 [Blyttiomyces sp. JEL0837]